MGLIGLGFEFRVELAGDEEGMIRNFDQFDELAIGRGSRKDHA